MAGPYSNSNGNYNYGDRYGYNQSYRDYSYPDSSSNSLIDDFRAFLIRSYRWFWRFWRERGRRMVQAGMVALARRTRQNLAYNRLFSVPHLLVCVWIVVLLWGERWVFHSKVEDCHWDNWEKWPPGATPHRVALVADPQLIDAHSYPGRPWPLQPLTIVLTDNYLRRSYTQLQEQLDPDSTFFLGDLFDGGREWKTAHGEFKDPAWGPHPRSEQRYLKMWNKKYGEFYWLKEYARFGDIFFNPWIKSGAAPGAEHKRRKIVASLPGNHDLGFGAEIKIPVRNRFETYFGEGNRVDVVGNHTFVSVDTVSMSAAASPEASKYDLKPIYKPTEHFLNEVRWLKQKAVEKELRFMRGEVPEVQFKHKIEDLNKADFKDQPSLGDQAPELPTILLTHVPLYRPPGTPCGPLRERSPPAKPPKGESGPVIPDHGNAISVSRGYQYQNVLDEQQSAELVKKVGNVVHAFSGDDHDYCELEHSEAQGSVREITVKSISMAMGVLKPGFLLVSLYNPLDSEGQPIAPSSQPTLQTHLCILPNQLSQYIRYVTLAFLCIVLLAVRAFLVPTLKLKPFALEPDPSAGSFTTILPVFKAKVEDYDEYAFPSAGFSASHFLHGSKTRDRSGSVNSSGLSSQARNVSPKGKRGHGHSKGSSGHWPGPSWGGGRSRGAPRIEIRSEKEEEEEKTMMGRWKAAPSAKNKKKGNIAVAITELWTTVWRTAWMVVGFFAWLQWKG
ncbi:putative cell division control protein [Cladorrhinum samala]|uniref:Cell division control protein n=1 Tax=Cladorrhinum samala TaxID=585594 RepID=A0AAV9HB28_9PEZI|nr:putative cell division control protein [Cladorrhinum samala]